jgi:hypothetical protein
MQNITLISASIEAGNVPRRSRRLFSAPKRAEGAQYNAYPGEGKPAANLEQLLLIASLVLFLDFRCTQYVNLENPEKGSSIYRVSGQIFIDFLDKNQMARRSADFGPPYWLHTFKGSVRLGCIPSGGRFLDKLYVNAYMALYHMGARSPCIYLWGQPLMGL